MSFEKVNNLPYNFMRPGVVMSFDSGGENHTLYCYEEQTYLRMFPYVESGQWVDRDPFGENLFSYVPLEYML